MSSGCHSWYLFNGFALVENSVVDNFFPRQNVSRSALGGGGAGGGGSESQDQTGKAESEQVFWRAARNTGVILRPQTPLSYPSQKKTVQNDVTLIHSENPSEKKHCKFCFKTTLILISCDFVD